MNDAQETFEVGNKTVKLYQDPDPSSPREDDNLGHMVCWHRRSNLGDEQIRPGEHADSIEEFREWLRKERKTYLILPIYIYEHSQITVTAREEVYARYPDKQWDAGQVGFIYVTIEKIVAEYGDVIEDEEGEKVSEALKGEVDTFDQYLQGDVWGYVIEDEEGEHLDSCWGFYGLDYAKEAATAAAGD